NFHDITEDNHIFALSKIIFDDDYSIYLGLTYQLDDMANEKDAIYNFDSYIFGYLSLGVKKDVMKETVLFGKDKYIDILAETYNVTPKEIKELTDLLDNYYHSSKEEQSKIYQEYVKKLGDILVRFYQTKGKLNEYEQFVLVSDIYNSKIVSAADILKTVDINNNLFNDLIVINVRDISYGNYNLYFDSKTHADITTLIYQEKLIDLLKNKGENLDYDDPDARFLVYLYVLAYEDKFTMKDRKELFSSPNAEELARYIIESNFDNDYAIEMHFEFLYGYFSNGKINFREMIDEIYGFSDDALSISLFIEYERCLKHEVLEGRLSEDAYQEQYDKLKERIAWGNDEIIEFVENAINNDESMFTDFNLPFSNIEYANDEIKKYTYETSEY
ncbi:MAG: hypothetical protein K2G03_00895, partial [Bacilli bacterium]|nr:hypothetical protein [Bacilli bacterium]